MIILALLLVAVPVSALVRNATDDGWRLATTVAGLRAREVVYLPEMRAFVIQTDWGPLGLSAISSHLGEPIAYCPASETFMELAHGSKWDRLGYYMDGPAPRGMDHVRTRVSEGLVEINPGIVSAGPPRGAGPPAAPTGPFCSFEVARDGAGGFLDPSPSAD